MKNFLVEEKERIEILKRHKLLVEQTKNNSQEIIRAGFTAGCFGQKGNDRYWGIIESPKGSGNYVFQKSTNDATMKSQGYVVVRIKPDNTFYYVKPGQNGLPSEFTQPRALLNPCPAMANFGKKTEDQVNNEYLIAQDKKDGFATVEELRAKGEDIRELANTQIWEKRQRGNVAVYKKVGTATGTMDDKENVRNQWVEKLRKDGYIVNPTDTEKDNYQEKKLYQINYSGLPEGLFSPNQLVYIDPKRADATILQDKQENESMKRKECKETIERFFIEFNRTKGRQITNRGLVQRMKDQAQFCKNEFEGKWGIGGGKFDEMIKLLSGRKSGGPSSSGDDSMFRLQ